MKITDYRKSNGQFKKKSKIRVFFNWIVIILVVIGVGSIFIPLKMNQIATETQVATQTDGLTPEQQATLQKQYELKKQETILMNKKEALDADYKAKSADIESQLQAIREQELSFSSAQSQ